MLGAKTLAKAKVEKTLTCSKPKCVWQMWLKIISSWLSRPTKDVCDGKGCERNRWRDPGLPARRAGRPPLGCFSMTYAALVSDWLTRRLNAVVRHVQNNVVLIIDGGLGVNSPGIVDRG